MLFCSPGIILFFIPWRAIDKQIPLTRANTIISMSLISMVMNQNLSCWQLLVLYSGWNHLLLIYQVKSPHLTFV